MNLFKNTLLIAALFIIPMVDAKNMKRTAESPAQYTGGEESSNDAKMLPLAQVIEKIRTTPATRGIFISDANGRIVFGVEKLLSSQAFARQTKLGGEGLELLLTITVYKNFDFSKYDDSKVLAILKDFKAQMEFLKENYLNTDHADYIKYLNQTKFNL